MSRDTDYISLDGASSPERKEGIFDRLFKSKETKLFEAIARGNVRMALKIMSEGADVNAVNKEGYSVIDEAAHYNHMVIIDELVKRGVSTAKIARECRGVLRAAVIGDFELVVRALIRDGVDVNATATTTYHDGVRYKDGDTALIAAAVYNKPNMVKILLDAGADVNIKNHMRLSALDYADIGGFKEIAEILSGPDAARRHPSSELKAVSSDTFMAKDKGLQSV